MPIRPGVIGSVASTYSDFCGSNYANFSNLVFRSNASLTNQITTSPAGTQPAGSGNPAIINNDRLVFTSASPAQSIRYNDNPNWQPGRGAAADGGFIATRSDSGLVNQSISSTGYGTTPAYSIRMDFYHNYPTTSGGVIGTVGNGSGIGWPTWTLALSTSGNVGTLRLYMSYNNTSNNSGDGTNSVNANHLPTGGTGTDTGSSSSFVFSTSVSQNIWYRVGLMFCNSSGTDTTSNQINQVKGYFGLQQSGLALANVFTNTCSYPYNHQPWTAGTDESPVALAIGSSISTSSPSAFIGGIKNVFIGRSRFW